MKSTLVRSLALAGLGSMLLAAGCVPEAKYKDCLAALRRANDARNTCQKALRELRGENQRLMGELEARNDVIDARTKALAQLQTSHDKLNEDFKTLYEKYRKAIGSAPVPTPVGDILLPPAVDKALRDFARANPDLVEYLPKYGMVKLKSDLTFAKGSDDVKPATRDALAKLVTIVNAAAAKSFNVYIAGHTDDIRIAKPETRRRHPSNWYLSVHRAVSVQKVLVQAGLAPERVGVLGFGEYHPIVPNRPNKKGNEANRRVEIWIVPPGRFLTASSD